MFVWDRVGKVELGKVGLSSVNLGRVKMDWFGLCCVRLGRFIWDSSH
jgi:hypothetical protein